MVKDRKLLSIEMGRLPFLFISDQIKNLKILFHKILLLVLPVVYVPGLTKIRLKNDFCYICNHKSIIW